MDESRFVRKIEILALNAAWRDMDKDMGRPLSVDYSSADSIAGKKMDEFAKWLGRTWENRMEKSKKETNDKEAL